MRKKTTAGFFALFLGPLGLHRFYLGQRARGMFYFAATLSLFALSVAENGPFVMIMPLVSLVDAMIFFSMPTEEFDEKYNGRYLQREMPRQGSRYFRRQRPNYQPAPGMEPSKAEGIEKFHDYDYEGAVEDFKKSLAKKYDDPAVHFNLACSYSLLEKPDPAFFHLTKAVQFGFVDFDKIGTHAGLAFLRTLPDYQEFVKNGYQRLAALPSPAEDLLAQTPAQQNEGNLLEQIQRLSELRNKGILTEDEFKVQTKKVLGN